MNELIFLNYTDHFTLEGMIKMQGMFLSLEKLEE